jgi:hypothetical protein
VGDVFQLALESVSRGVWHCVAQHFRSAAQRSAKLPGRTILKPIGSHFVIYLGLGVYGHGVCVCILFMVASFRHMAAFRATFTGPKSTQTQRNHATTQQTAKNNQKQHNNKQQNNKTTKQQQHNKQHLIHAI